MMRFDNKPFDWNVEFDSMVKNWIDTGNHDP